MPFQPAPWRSPLVNFIDRLKDVRQRLTNERTLFWQAKEEEYRNLCAKIMQMALALVRPPDAEEEEWLYLCRLIASYVASEQLKGEVPGLVIFIAEQYQQAAFEQLVGPGEEVLAKDSIMSWVKAGRSGDPSGKEFNDEDYQRTDAEIAGLVWMSMSRHESTTTQDAVRRYMAERAVERFAPYLQAIVASWRVGLVDRVRHDFRLWVRGVIANSQG